MAVKSSGRLEPAAVVAAACDPGVMKRLAIICGGIGRDVEKDALETLDVNEAMTLSAGGWRWEIQTCAAPIPSAVKTIVTTTNGRARRKLKNSEAFMGFEFQGQWIEIESVTGWLIC